MNPPPSSTIPSNSTTGRVCCDLMCSGELQKNYEPLPLIIANARALFLHVFNAASSEFRLLISFSPTEPISYGRTQQRHITRDFGFLSYPASAIVTVLAKGVYFGENGEEFWEAEVREEVFCIFSHYFFFKYVSLVNKKNQTHATHLI